MKSALRTDEVAAAMCGFNLIQRLSLLGRKYTLSVYHSSTAGRSPCLAAARSRSGENNIQLFSYTFAPLRYLKGRLKLPWMDKPYTNTNIFQIEAVAFRDNRIKNEGYREKIRYPSKILIILNRPRSKTFGFPHFYFVFLFYLRFLAQRTLVRFSLFSRRFLT